MDNQQTQQPLMDNDETKELDEQVIIIDNVVNDKLTDKELAEIKNDESNTEWDELPTPPESPTLGEAQNYFATAVQAEKLAKSIMDDEVKAQCNPAKPVDEQPKDEPTLHTYKCIRCGVDFTSYTKGDLYCGLCDKAIDEVKQKAKTKIKKFSTFAKDVILKLPKKKFIDDLILTVDKHTMVSKELKFTDHLNTTYEVLENQAQYLDECETFADIARRGFDPNVNKDTPVYGVARRMEPKNVTIARMKADIDQANNELLKRQKAYSEYVAQLEQQAKQANQPQPSNEPKGDPK